MQEFAEGYVSPRADLEVLGILALSVSFSLALVVTRVWYTQSPAYGFLIWNLFLAGLPFVISSLLKYPFKHTPAYMFALMVGLWLLFFPNAPYLLTDLFHLRQQGAAPLWFDLVLLFSFAWNGLMLGFVSLADMQGLIARRFNRLTAGAFVGLTLFLTSFGIYLGRFLRWNSWDVLGDPLGLFGDVLNRLLYPFEHPRTWLFTALFTVLLTLCYFSLGIVKHLVHARR